VTASNAEGSSLNFCVVKTIHLRNLPYSLDLRSNFRDYRRVIESADGLIVDTVINCRRIPNEGTNFR
jgi:hypothetical protein